MCNTIQSPKVLWGKNFFLIVAFFIDEESKIEKSVT